MSCIWSTHWCAVRSPGVARRTSFWKTVPRIRLMRSVSWHAWFICMDGAGYATALWSRSRKTTIREGNLEPAANCAVGQLLRFLLGHVLHVVRPHGRRRNSVCQSSLRRGESPPPMASPEEVALGVRVNGESLLVLLPSLHRLLRGGGRLIGVVELAREGVHHAPSTVLDHLVGLLAVPLEAILGAHVAGPIP